MNRQSLLKPFPTILLAATLLSGGWAISRFNQKDESSSAAAKRTNLPSMVAESAGTGATGHGRVLSRPADDSLTGGLDSATPGIREVPDREGGIDEALPPPPNEPVPERHVAAYHNAVSGGVPPPGDQPRSATGRGIGSSDGKAGLLHYIVNGATHQWIAFQGYVALPPGDLKTEMANYLPTDPEAPAYGSYLNGQSVNEQWLDIVGPEYDNADHAIVPGDAVIQGAYEEDAAGVLDGTIDGVHFWNPDGGHTAGLVLDGTAYPSAFQEAQEETFVKALAAYPDRKAEAYYWLGRTAHLLADMSVPSHAHLDGHSGLSTDDEEFEEEVAASYKNITAASPNAQIPTAFPFAVPAGYPAAYDAELSNLFYNLAKTSKQYDSDEVNGTSTEFGMGIFRSARNALTIGKTVERVEYWDTDLGFPSAKRRDMIAGTDYAIQSIGEYRIYYYESFYNDINSTSRMVRVFYTDGSDDSFLNLDETSDDVFTEPLRFIYQPNLEAQAIGYTAALYQLFWARTRSSPPLPTTFQITSIRRLLNPGPAVELTFPSELAATYRVQHSPSLPPPAVWTDAGVSATGTGAEMPITAPDPGSEGRYFFRVVKM